MPYLLDTNTCINYLNGTSENIKRHFISKHPSEIVVCSVVKAELLYGALKSAKPTENVARVHYFVDQFVSLPFDDPASEKYSEIRAGLEKAGTPIGPNDLFIASIAVANTLVLVTHNTREFKRVEELTIDDWEGNSHEHNRPANTR